MDPSTTKLSASLPAVLSLAGLDDAGRLLIADATDLESALKCLVAHEALDAALRLYAFALPPREAVWWATMCCSSTAGHGQPIAEIWAREAAERWVRRQDETSRREAMAAAEAVGMQGAEAYAAIAAFWSGGSIAPSGQAEVPPRPHLLGTAVHGAVTTAAIRPPVKRRTARLGRFLVSAGNIASGGLGQIEREAP